MSESKTELKKLVFEALSFYLQSKGIQDAITEGRVSVEVPPSAEMGDLGIPMFAFAKTFRMAPALLSNEIAKLINDNFSEICPLERALPLSNRKFTAFVNL